MRRQWASSRNKSGARFDRNMSKDSELSPVVSDEKAKARRERFKALSEETSKEYGLVSRGEEKKLQNDPQAQAEYFNLIQREFLIHCSGISDKNVLKAELAKVTGEEPDEGRSQIRDIEWVLMSLRKLREALLTSKPSEFSKKVFLYAVRISTKIGVYQTYLPSLNYLVSTCKPLLSAIELEEVATYLILHTSHFNNDSLKAFQLYFQLIPKSEIVKQILEAWVSQDYLNWKLLRTKIEINLGYYKLMAFGEHKILNAYLSDIGKAYFVFPKPALEELAGKPWDKLKDEFKLKWTLENTQLTIRKRIKKTS